MGINISYKVICDQCNKTIDDDYIYKNTGMNVHNKYDIDWAIIDLGWKISDEHTYCPRCKQKMLESE